MFSDTDFENQKCMPAPSMGPIFMLLVSGTSLRGSESAAEFWHTPALLGRQVVSGVPESTLFLSCTKPTPPVKNRSTAGYQRPSSATLPNQGENEAWKAIPGGLYLKFPVAKARARLQRWPATQAASL